MRGVWAVERVRDAERRVFERTPEAALMRRAAFAVAVRSAELLAEQTGGTSGRRVALLVGAGNNGGDALWAGAFLRRRGVAVTAVLLAPDRVHAEGLAALLRAGGRRVVASGDSEAARDAVADADLVIDGIVGLSGRGPLRPDAEALVDAVTGLLVAVDLPSGVDPDTGAVAGPAVGADVTVTFGGRKPGHVLAEGAVLSGAVTVADIGLGEALGEPDIVLLDPADIGALWPVPGPEDDKYTQGVAGVAAGSATYPGAAVLAAGAAVLATSGMVRYAGPAADAVRTRWPEIVATGSIADAGRVQAWVVGPGLGTGAAGRDVLAHVLDQGVPVCADADAINLLASTPELWDVRDPETPLVLTPHDREFARLAGEVGTDRVAAARRAAERYNAVVLLKGHTTVVAAPDGRVLVNQARGAWPATAGSGDVLSGLIGALLAAGMDPWLAAGCAAGVHELAGDLAADGAPIGASALLRAVPDAVRRVRAAAAASA
ncbi:bifunctional ADP-dependent NAD(P)H-hydrate dehydratase/NAD(P)H-hydrate epimerase [Streptoalloteichus hindustanus]|uniref:Bifunctional NAD(P)H-hydrate repair enzyme n=1 Tax=Streptoalloteichus hindustanus TaxID=2017 RepID=A0A1M4TBL6_STRHI|nr:bifunctional ADP-dependent NAD(P)H-hydrate dehydratase/NAD(P)H-hydrate epimerase [Streptoalloteichus hindustanus]SHE41850.1 yjeF C-terminal region, hydroxyethylthiazole kinase-related/yjeF N-terminal region [Streptoalloteichus hindustanus]